MGDKKGLNPSTDANASFILLAKAAAGAGGWGVGLITVFFVFELHISNLYNQSNLFAVDLQD